MAEVIKPRETAHSADYYLLQRKDELNRRFKNWGATVVVGTGAMAISPLMGPLGPFLFLGGLIADGIGLAGMSLNLLKRPFVRKSKKK